MAAWTLRRSDSLTGTEPVMTWDTVPTATPAKSATSLIVGMLRRAATVEGAVLHLLQPDILRLDLHGIRGLVKLNPDQPAHRAPRLVIVDQLRHDVPVDELDDGVSSRDDVDLVPVVAFDEVLQ